MGGMVRRERVRLGLLEGRSKPAPFETQGCGTRSEGLGERIRCEQDALATRGDEIFSGNSAYGRVEAKFWSCGYSVVEDAAMATTSMSAPEAQPRVNPFGRIIGVFFSPKQTFTSIAERPSWLVPLLLCAVLATCVGAMLNTKMNWGEYIRHKAEDNPRFAQMSEEQKDQALGGQVKFWSNFSYGVGVVAVPISALIFALIYWGAFNVFRGASLRFGQSFGIVTHAFLPTAISSILALIVLPLKSYGDVDPENVLATSLKAYLPESAPKTLLALGGSLELFWIWCLVLVAIGFAAANSKKIKPGASFGIVFGMWAVWVLVKVAWAAI